MKVASSYFYFKARFKLPRNKFGFTGFRNVVSDFVSESLPNIAGFATGSTNQVGQFQQNTRNGCVETYNNGPGYVTTQFSTSMVAADSFQVNASWSSSTYQDGAPVQQKAIQVYLEFYLN